MITDVESLSQPINDTTITITKYTTNELTYSTFFTVINHRLVSKQLNALTINSFIDKERKF